MRTITAAVVASLAAVAPARGHAQRRDAPVLVELFTSEGCSSCPPADAVLARLLAQPPEGVQVIALGEHVDTWDELGWRDRYSAPAFTHRQERYARRFGLSGSYTPQLVIAGTRQVLGGDERAARAAIAAASREPEGVAEVRVRGREGADVLLDVRAEWVGPARRDVLIALVQARARDRVEAGENAGRVLDHVAVARSLQPVAVSALGYRGTVRIPRREAEGSDRVVLIVQDQGGGPIRAVASEELGRAP